MAERGHTEHDGGGWSGRVAFSDTGGFAYRPGELLVHQAGADSAERLLRQRMGKRSGLVREKQARGSWVLFRGVDDSLRAVEELRPAGVAVQPNHVLFSHCLCCCGPHPAALWANPFTANPFTANPFTANPFTANAVGANPFSANPFTANPFTANDHQPSPVALAGAVGPEVAEFRATGRRRHSAHPATAPGLPAPAGDPRKRSAPSIVVVDTGIAGKALVPNALTGVSGYSSSAFPPEEAPDEDGDQRIDPVAGHGTFIAGVVEAIAPGCRLHVHGLLTGYGDASEDDVALTLEALLGAKGGPPQLLNLSFGGYALGEMARLAEAVRALQDAGTVVVASAGNDGTCRPSFPAAFPGVVSVGALGSAGPAFFTNYGPWVRACAPGVDVVSTFFTEWKSPSGEDEEYAEWVRWSGTSFAAPAVVGALARAMRDGLDGGQAVDRVIDAPGLFRIPNLGTVVNQVACWQRP